MERRKEGGRERDMWWENGSKKMRDGERREDEQTKMNHVTFLLRVRSYV